MSQDQYNAKLKGHSQGHASYWKGQGKNIEIHRFEDGFHRGWDAAKQEGDALQKLPWWLEQHKKANPEKDCHNPLAWEFEHGFKEGIDAYRSVCGGGGGGQPSKNYDDPRRDSCLKRDRAGHENYWKCKNTQVNLNIYDAGYRAGWKDAVDGCNSEDKRKEKQFKYQGEHHNEYNLHSLIWEFEHGYNEAVKAQKGH